MTGIVTGRRTTSTTVSPNHGDRLVAVDTRHGRFSVRWRAGSTIGTAVVTVEQDASYYTHGVPTARMHVGRLAVYALDGVWPPSHLVALAAAVDHWVYVEEQLQAEADYAAEQEQARDEDREAADV
ncbi:MULTISPECIES: hypothetical protein [unclassified Egicoccus]|uniref:hypothetical protein n=1 Tax=unclassified Egicoccus TaxID=2635606 RepID=UPI00359E83AE